ncbi:11204_t:CDS:1, partial [Cetraspora pellucida]
DTELTIQKTKQYPIVSYHMTAMTQSDHVSESGKALGKWTDPS